MAKRVKKPPVVLTCSFLAPDGAGGWREANELDMILAWELTQWAALGLPMPKARVQTVIAEYEAEQRLGTRLDLAA